MQTYILGKYQQQSPFSQLNYPILSGSEGPNIKLRFYDYKIKRFYSHRSSQGSFWNISCLITIFTDGYLCFIFQEIPNSEDVELVVKTSTEGNSNILLDLSGTVFIYFMFIVIVRTLVNWHLILGFIMSEFLIIYSNNLIHVSLLC